MHEYLIRVALAAADEAYRQRMSQLPPKDDPILHQLENCTQNALDALEFAAQKQPKPEQ